MYVGFSVLPHGDRSPGISFEGGRGGSTLRGRGRGGGLASSHRIQQHTLSSDSGVSTPVTGLGYHKHGPPSSLSRSTIGKAGANWGGGAAPLFVKAGELFKDGIVDVVRRDRGDVSIEKWV